MHNPEIALPDHGDTVEDRAEQDALAQDSRRPESEVGDVSGGDSPCAGKYLAEYHQPEDGLHGAGKKLGRVTKKFLEFDLRYRTGVPQKFPYRRFNRDVWL